jgi:hypothetical protein
MRPLPVRGKGDSLKRLLAIAALLAAGLAAAEDAPRIAGTIELAAGDVLLEAKDGATRAPVEGGEVLEGDTITTFAKGELHLRMADGASIIVREASKITLTAYVADGGEEDRSLIDLAKGALRSITGWIGEFNRERYAVRTPLVTIGVRGTDHEPTHLLPGDPRGEPGSYDKVNEGRVFMQSKEGVVEVPKGRSAFRARARPGRARLLASHPRFYRPGRFERRFEGRAREARQHIRERRQARREHVRKLRGGPGARKPGARPAPRLREKRQEVREKRMKRRDKRGRARERR